MQHPCSASRTPSARSGPSGVWWHTPIKSGKTRFRCASPSYTCIASTTGYVSVRHKRIYCLGSCHTCSELPAQAPFPTSQFACKSGSIRRWNHRLCCATHHKFIAYEPVFSSRLTTLFAIMVTTRDSTQCAFATTFPTSSPRSNVPSPRAGAQSPDPWGSDSGDSESSLPPSPLPASRSCQRDTAAALQRSAKLAEHLRTTRPSPKASAGVTAPAPATPAPTTMPMPTSVAQSPRAQIGDTPTGAAPTIDTPGYQLPDWMQDAYRWIASVVVECKSLVCSCFRDNTTSRDEALQHAN